MSGIIGGAGSKSGVIGTTELDYEEGTWTPTYIEGTIGTTQNARYVKIGSQVTLYIGYHIAPTSSNTSVSQGVNNLPFTVGSSYATGTLVSTTDHVARILAIAGQAKTFYYQDGSTSSKKANVISGATFYGWSVTYSIAT